MEKSTTSTSPRAWDGYRDPRDLVNITRGLVGRSYTDEQVRGVLAESFLRVFEQVKG